MPALKQGKRGNDKGWKEKKQPRRTEDGIKFADLLAFGWSRRKMNWGELAACEQPQEQDRAVQTLGSPWADFCFEVFRAETPF